MELAINKGKETKPDLPILDRVGTCVSLACAVHCILLPFVITALPFLGLGFLAGGMFELCMILFTITLASLSLCWGTRIHGKRQVLFFVLAGLFFFITGHTFDNHWHWIFMAVGGVSLASGHLINRKLCKSCPDCSR